MNTKLIAVLCQTHDRKPLVTIDGLPGDHADLRPDQLRTLADALLRIADDCEAQPMGLRSYRRQKRECVLLTPTEKT